MKKRAILAMSILSGVCQLFAQDLEFQLGPAISEDPETRSIFFNPTLGKGYAVTFPLCHDLDEYVKYNPAGNTIKAEVFTRKEKAVIEAYHVVGEKNYIIYSTRDKDRNEHNVYMQEMSKQATLLGSPLLVAKYDKARTALTDITIVGGGGLLGVSNLYVARPRSNEFIVFVKERESKLEIKAFSPDKGELWTKAFDLKSDMPYRITDVAVANNGNVYVGGQYFKKDEDLNPFLLAYNPTNTKFQLHAIKSGDKVEDLGYRLVLVRDETPVFAGIFAQKKDVGYKIFKLDPANLALQQLASKPFSPEYSTVIFQGAYKPKYFGVKGIVELKNKSLVIDFEGGAGQSSSHMSNIYSSPVYLASVDIDGNEQWNVIIQKYQVQPLRGDLVGHALFLKGDKVYVMYNDDIDNLDADPTQKAGDGLIKKKMYVALVEVDGNGNAKKYKPITSAKNQNSFFRPGEVREISPTLFHMMFMKAGKYHFATVAL